MTHSDHLPLGWICPRCGHVWAPDVRECTCAPEPEADNEPQPGKVYIGFVPAGRLLHYVETRSDG